MLRSKCLLPVKTSRIRIIGSQFKTLFIIIFAGLLKVDDDTFYNFPIMAKHAIILRSVSLKAIKWCV